ncbi:MAG: DUF6340 family protein [Breznakibacter sp.]
MKIIILKNILKLGFKRHSMMVIGGGTLMTLSSCLTSKPFNIDVLKPAEYTVPVDIKNVVVANNAYRIGDSIEVLVNKQGGQYIKSNPDTVPEVVLKQLTKSLAERRFFDTVYYYPRPLTRMVVSGGIKPVSNNELQVLRNTCNADAAIVLQGYKIIPSIDYILVSDETKYYHVEQSVDAEFTWLFIDLRTDSVLNVYKQTDVLDWTAFSEKFKYPVPGLPSFKESIVVTADLLGFAYADYISPNWQSTERYYYSSNAGYYGEADQHVKNNEWDKASKIWFGLYEVAKKSTKARLAHNIALSYEMMGNFEDASLWAHESWTIYNKLSDWFGYEKDREAKYFETLVKRSIDAKKLEGQIGG